jgi:hypothetical protein
MIQCFALIARDINYQFLIFTHTYIFMQKSIRAIFFPYCLLQRKDKKWVILNRNYKPVGVSNGEWVDYDAVPADVCIKSITSIQRSRLSCGRENSDPFRIYLYNDECVPNVSREHMDAYLAKIALLMRLKVGAVKS